MRNSVVVQSPGVQSPTSGVQAQPLTIAVRFHSPHCTEDETN